MPGATTHGGKNPDFIKLSEADNRNVNKNIWIDNC